MKIYINDPCGDLDLFYRDNIKFCKLGFSIREVLQPVPWMLVNTHDSVNQCVNSVPIPGHASAECLQSHWSSC